MPSVKSTVVDKEQADLVLGVRQVKRGSDRRVVEVEA
jgi:hypothetical protein